MLRIAAVLLLLPAAALADQAGADKCAKSLPKDARAIYDKVGPDVAPGGDVRAALQASVPGMVRAGEIGRASARANAQAAGKCLVQR